MVGGARWTGRGDDDSEKSLYKRRLGGECEKKDKKADPSRGRTGDRLRLRKQIHLPCKAEVINR